MSLEFPTPKLKPIFPILLSFTLASIQFVRNTNDLHADGESSLRRLAPAVFAAFYFPRVGSIVVTHLSADTANLRSQSMSRSIRNERSRLSLVFWSWTMCGSCVLFFFLSPRSPPATIDRSIDRSRSTQFFAHRSPRTTISPWAASLRDCGRYFVSTCCERWMRARARARACIYKNCLANCPEFCLANWPQLSLPSLPFVRHCVVEILSCPLY